MMELVFFEDKESTIKDQDWHRVPVLACTRAQKGHSE